MEREFQVILKKKKETRKYNYVIGFLSKLSLLKIHKEHRPPYSILTCAKRKTYFIIVHS